MPPELSMAPRTAAGDGVGVLMERPSAVLVREGSQGAYIGPKCPRQGEIGDHREFLHGPDAASLPAPLTAASAIKKVGALAPRIIAVCRARPSIVNSCKPSHSLALIAKT